AGDPKNRPRGGKIPAGPGPARVRRARAKSDPRRPPRSATTPAAPGRRNAADPADRAVRVQICRRLRATLATIAPARSICRHQRWTGAAVAQDARRLRRPTRQARRVGALDRIRRRPPLRLGPYFRSWRGTQRHLAHFQASRSRSSARALAWRAERAAVSVIRLLPARVIASRFRPAL